VFFDNSVVRSLDKETAMGMDSMLDAMRKEMEESETRMIKSIRDRTSALRGQPWVNNQEIAGPALEEAKDATEYYHMGLSRKILNAVTRGLPTEQFYPVAMNVTAVMADKANIEMLDQLLLIAYLRGVAKALELTGQHIPASSDCQRQSAADEQSEESEEVCPHCGQVHSEEHDGPTLAESLREFAELSKMLSTIHPDLCSLTMGAGPYAGLGK
jgi:hypothetical protein